jgi:antitoxin component YwqK of YwqJK toxin-antitoxin module
MSRLISYRICGLLVAMAVGIGGIAGVASAQERQKNSVKIEPYKGEPIFLDEVKQVADPAITRREALTERFPDGKVRIERNIAHFSDGHFEADGQYREFYPNGQVFLEGQYKRGRQDGEWTYYYDNGKLNRKAKFIDGKPDGPREIFRADGTLASKKSFAEGLRDGEWVTYDPTGKTPVSEEHYVKGKPDGVWKYWFPNGKQRQEISLKDGVREGLTTEWDDKGEKRFEATFVKGKLHGTATRWFPDGRKIVQEYDNGKLVKQSS